MTTDATESHRFDRRDGSANLLLPFTSFVARGQVVGVTTAVDDLGINR